MANTRRELAKYNPLVTKQKYQKTAFQWRWIHLPANNVDWMMKEPIVMKNRKEDDLNATKQTPATDVSSLDQTTKETKDTETEKYWRVALYMPYLTFATSRPDDERKKKYDKLEEWYKDKILHGPRTLDRFYYYSLSDTGYRDATQVVTKYIDERTGRKQDEPQKILQVDQLWLWVIDERTIITSSTYRLDKSEDPVLNKVFESLKQTNDKTYGQSPSSVDEMSRFIIRVCVGFIDHSVVKIPNAGESETRDSISTRQIFANTINSKAAFEADLFTHFNQKLDEKLLKLVERGLQKANDGQMRHLDELKNECEGRIDKRKDNPNGSEGGTDGQDDGRLNDYNSISKATRLLEEVKDIRDELNILRFLLEQQNDVWEKLVDGAYKEPMSKASTYTIKKNKVMDRWRGRAYVVDEIDEMDKMVEGIQASVNSLLSLEQNEASIEQAQVTIRQGKILMAFTIVTILFLELQQ
ncbi:hypothetical protein K469DRAFT_687459 [Zopfia rhizophila CBS 207.26]|uniref:Uncharacterized protein n=1 Tax=Zopfia rhizophila CBS 207.26 TaxID=1314779 RepID=A0A6A6E5L1_9PEZI|nr:hypothetical protein K469DRAFT_687459 [Zopfia rhizophila CBS 207.26]